MYAHDARGRASKQEGTSVGELTLMGGDEDAEAGAAEERDATDIEVHRAAACLLVFFEQFGELASVGEVPFAVRAYPSPPTGQRACAVRI
jgi:hypothetical protein